MRIARRVRFELRLIRPALLRPDFRDAFPVSESSKRAPPFRSARIERFRDPLRPAPTLRSVALTPGSDVSVGKSRLGRRGCLGFGGFAFRCCSVLKRCALVAMARNLTRLLSAAASDLMDWLEALTTRECLPARPRIAIARRRAELHAAAMGRGPRPRVGFEAHAILRGRNGAAATRRSPGRSLWRCVTGGLGGCSARPSELPHGRAATSRARRIHSKKGRPE